MLKKLFPHVLMTFLICNYALSQSKVSGIVVDSTGLPIIGVNVLIKGTTIGTVTDFYGKYSLEVPNKNSLLIFSSIGYTTIEVLVGDRTLLDIVLHESDSNIEEIVVTGLGVKKYKYKPKKNYVSVRVYFASDRNLTENKDVGRMFGGERSNNGANYGICEVSIPRKHKIGELEKASVWKFEFNDDPEKHVSLLNVKVKTKNDFFVDLKKRINQSPEKNAFLFVHGYNVSFEDASRRTAQMSYDLGFNGAPVFYSWPSRATLWSYNIDEGNIEWSEGNLKKFLEDFLTKSSAKNIYLIAHSMGNRGLTRALASITKENPKLTEHIKEIILAAPDIDAAVFKRDIAPALIQCKKPVTLYACSNDFAMIGSQILSNYPRAGMSGKEMVILSGIDTIDASNVNVGLLGHSYFMESPVVISDIFQIIHHSQRPKDRPYLKMETNVDGQSFWQFKK